MKSQGLPIRQAQGKQGKKKVCDICGKEFLVTSDESVCDNGCFSGCCDPSYHNGEPCDGSC